MITWWSNLILLKKFFYLIAIPSTAFLGIRGILVFLGIGENIPGFDNSKKKDKDEYNAVDKSLFSIQGFCVFFTFFSWCGILLSPTSMNSFVIISISALAGIVSMVLIGVLLSYIDKINKRDSISYIFENNVDDVADRENYEE